MAPDPTVLHHNITGAAEIVFHGHHALLQSGGSGDYLENGSRLIGIVDTAVPPHPVQQVLFFLLRKPFRHRSLRKGKRIVQVKFRHIDHGQDFAVIRLHHQDGNAFRLLGRQRLVSQLRGILLNIHIQADMQVVAVHRLHPVLPLLRNLHSSCVGHRQDRSRFSLEIFVILDLQPHNSLVVASCKAQDLGSKAVKGIIPLIVLIHLDAVQLVITDNIPYRFVHIALYFFYGGVFFHALSDIFLFKPQLPGKHLHHFVRIRNLVVDNGNITYRPVIRQHRSCGIYYSPPLGLDVSFPLVKLLGRLCIVGGLIYHQIDQPSGQAQKGGQAEHKGPDCFLSVECFVFLFHWKTS